MTDLIYNLDDVIDAKIAAEPNLRPTDRVFLRVKPGQVYSYYTEGRHLEVEAAAHVFEITSIVHERTGVKCHERCPGGICPYAEPDPTSPLLVGPRRF